MEPKQKVTKLPKPDDEILNEINLKFLKYKTSSMSKSLDFKKQIWVSDLSR